MDINHGEDPLSSLPLEVASYILSFVPPRELLSVCTRVCRGWKDFLTDPIFWKSKMRQGGNYSSVLDKYIGSTHWAKLCFYTLYHPNLINTFDKDGNLTMDPWNSSSSDWEYFKTQKCIQKAFQARKYTNLPPFRSRRDKGGGNQWTTENWIKKDTDIGVLEDNNGCLQNYVTSYGWCSRDQLIDLARFGFAGEIMDEVRPAIAVSEWFCARWDCGSVYCIHVDLLDADLKVIKSFEQMESTDQWQGGELGWRKVQHVFCDYGPGVRYVRFADAGKDTQFWAGHYGSKMAGAWVKVLFNHV